MAMDAINPATGEEVKSYQEMSPKQAAQAIEQAHQAHVSWRKAPFAQRAKLLKGAALILK